MKPVPELALVQGERPSRYARRGVAPGKVPWDVHVRAWEGYARQFGCEQSAERIAERGGFGYREMQIHLAGLKCPVSEDVVLPEVPGWEPR